jgi:hypothetical protein
MASSFYKILNSMAQEGMSGLEDIMMGQVGEEVKESDEQIAARAAAAQKKIAAIKRDEKSAKSFDHKLAKIIPQLDVKILDFVIFLIDHEVPSLTALALITLANDKAGKICHVEFNQYIAETADFSIVKFADPEIEEKISLWWTFIFASDHVSTTTKLQSFRGNEAFVKRVSAEFSTMLKKFIIENKVEGFNESQLTKTLKKYADAAFAENPLEHEVHN